MTPTQQRALVQGQPGGRWGAEKPAGPEHTDPGALLRLSLLVCLPHGSPQGLAQSAWETQRGWTKRRGCVGCLRGRSSLPVSWPLSPTGQQGPSIPSRSSGILGLGQGSGP